MKENLKLLNLVLITSIPCLVFLACFLGIKNFSNKTSTGVEDFFIGLFIGLVFIAALVLIIKLVIQKKII